MKQVQIDTLTAVHIGSGDTFQYGNDFVKGVVDNCKMLGIIDSRKVMNLIGEDNINKWVAAIEKRKPTDEIVKIYAPNATIEQYSKRLIVNWAVVTETDTLKEHIHDGLGHPYIPGSSIKGAIRTAVLSSTARNTIGLESFIKDSRGRVNAKGVEAKLFGKDPNSDVFRFLQVGDAIFGDEYEVALKMVSINERKSQSYWDTGKPQLIEAIGPDDSSTFQMKINLDLYDKAKQAVHQLPECLSSIPTLFQTINYHTENLLDTEIIYWQKRVEDDTTGIVTKYIQKIRNVLDEVRKCDKGKECVLRIGHASGWRFITGAWTEQLNNFKVLVVPTSRPKNNNYSNFDFPKTRRVDLSCDLLGFVKLTIH